MPAELREVTRFAELCNSKDHEGKSLLAATLSRDQRQSLLQMSERYLDSLDKLISSTNNTWTERSRAKAATGPRELQEAMAEAQSSPKTLNDGLSRQLLPSIHLGSPGHFSQVLVSKLSKKSHKGSRI